MGMNAELAIITSADTSTVVTTAETATTFFWPPQLQVAINDEEKTETTTTTALANFGQNSAIVLLQRLSRKNSSHET
jgi:hypothetical protein